MAADPVLRFRVKLCGDPRLVSAAKQLGVPKVYLIGALVHLACQALDHAEDGDLWRGDEESSARFAAALADWPGDAEEFAAALRREGWMEEWMIAGWLEYVGDYFYRKYRTGNRRRLEEIYAKNGRGRGKSRGGTDGLPTLVGLSDARKHPLTHNPAALIPCTPAEKKKRGPATRSPSTPPEKEIQSPDGGAGENADPDRSAGDGEGRERGASFISFNEGLRERGIALSLDDLDCSGLTHLEVYEAFRPVFVFHSLATLEAFYFRCNKCGCTPAWWTMVYLDKVHAVYRTRPEGNAWLEDGADPVAMTMAAILPSYGRRHTPSGAARQFFLEIMIDHARSGKGEKSRWAGCVTGNFIAKELDLRKGKAGKIA